MKETSRRNILSAIGVGAAAAAVGTITKSSSAAMLASPTIVGIKASPLVVPAAGTKPGTWALLTFANSANGPVLAKSLVTATAPKVTALGISADALNYTVALFNNGAGVAIQQGNPPAKQTVRCNTNVHVGIL